MKTKQLKLKATLLSLLLCLALPGWATVTVTYSSSAKSLYVSGSGEVTADIVNAVDGHENAVEIQFNSANVTSIGASAFSECTSLRRVSIPSTITTIGNYAFQGCNDLISIEFKSGTTSLTIGAQAFGYTNTTYTTTFYCYRPFTYSNYASDNTVVGKSGLFSNNQSLTSVILGANVTTIPQKTFESCHNLKKVTTTDATDLKTIGLSAFMDCTSLAEFTIPSSVTAINGGVFEGCTSLTTIDIPSGVTIIGGSTFKNCTSLKTVTLPSTVKTIGNSAFQNTAVTKVTYPDHLETIGESAFEGSSLAVVNIPGAVTSIGARAYADCNHFQSVILNTGSKTLEIGKQAFAFNSPNNVIVSIYRNFTYPQYSGTDLGDKGLFYKNTSVYKAEVGGAVTTINAYTFTGCSNLKILSLSDATNLTTIGLNAFEDCTSLGNFTLPESLTNINGSAFEGCSSISSVTIPSGVTSLSVSAFKGTGLTEITIPGTVTTINQGAFQDCNNIKKVTFAAGTTTLTINGLAFSFVNNTDGVEFECNRPYTFSSVSSDLTVGKNGLFYMNPSLKSATFGPNVTTIYDYTFLECTGLKTVDMTKATELTKINQRAFQGSGVETITFGPALTTISNQAFENCASLGNFTLPESLTNINGSAFEGCSSMTSLTIPSKVTTLSGDAFKGTGLTSISIPGTVKEILNGTFENCDHLRSITFESGSTNLTVRSQAFNFNNTTDEEVVFNYNRNTTKDITGIVDGATGSTNVFFNNKCLTSVVIGSGVTTIPQAMFSGCSSLTNIDMTNATNLKTIEVSAFYNCDALKIVKVAESVTNIYAQAFLGSDNLEYAVLASTSTKYVENSSFPASTIVVYGEDGILTNWVNSYTNKDTVTEIFIPNDYIANHEYYSSSNLSHVFPAVKKVTFGPEVTKIGDCIFSNSITLETVELQGEPKAIGKNAFHYNQNLSTINAENISSIDERGFHTCYSLTRMNLTNCTSIGDMAFGYCTGLAEIGISGAMKKDGFSADAVVGCSSLKTLYIDNDELLNSEVYYGRSSRYFNNTLENVTIGPNVNSIGSIFFDGCTSLTNLTINSAAIANPETAYTSDSNLKTIFPYVTNLTFGGKVTEIGTFAFNGTNVAPNDKLTSLTLGENTTTIGAKAFEQCVGLTSIVIPFALNNLASNAFRGCSNLTDITINSPSIASTCSTEDGYYPLSTIFSFAKKVTFGPYVHYIAHHSLYNGTGDFALKEVAFLSETAIGENAFTDCQSLTTITGSVKAVSLESFMNTGIESITITDDNGIENKAFYGCSKLKSVTLPSNVTVIGDYTFRYCPNLESINLPSGLESIGKGAFMSCESLKSINIPANVAFLGNKAFAGCLSLATVTCLRETPVALSEESLVFDGISEKAQLFVLGKSLEAYRTADVWKNFYDIFAIDGALLTDGVEYENYVDQEVAIIRYNRTFSEKVVGKWQCFYVPFDVPVTDELLQEFDFAKLYMVSFKDENCNGEIDDDESLAMVVNKLSAGKTLVGNTPYFVRVKSAGTKTIEVENTILRAADEPVIVDCSTTEHKYTLTGVYESFNLNGYYTMNTGGSFSYYTEDKTLKPYRWYMNIEDRSGNKMEAKAINIYVEGEDDTTGIMDINDNGNENEASIYTLDGRKVNSLESMPQGIYIVNGKKVMKR